MISNQRTSQLTAILGGLCFVVIVALTWLPQPCSVLQRCLYGCPGSALITAKPGDQAWEQQQRPHQEIRSATTTVTTPVGGSLRSARVVFEYQLDRSAQQLTLEIAAASGFVPVALITHPLLVSLDWSTVGTSEYRFYERSERQHSLTEAIAAITTSTATYKSKELAVDQAAARAYNLAPSRYTALETLSSLDGIQAILTSYRPSYQNGDWFRYEQHVDLDAAVANPNNEITFRFHSSPSQADQPGLPPLRLSPLLVTFHEEKPLSWLTHQDVKRILTTKAEKVLHIV